MSARLADGEVFDSAKLKNTVRFLIENDMRNVVIDLGNLEYLYSDTINAFIASNRHMLEVSGRIAILTEHPKVQDILKRAGLDNIMRIYRSEAEMIADSKEILRQTSSYRIEELQKFSSQPQEHPQIPRTEFDEFKAEMGQRLGSKLDNNELPQYQLGVPPSPTATPGPFGQGPRNPETNYPTFNAPNFSPTQIPEAPNQSFPRGQNAPAYNAFNNQVLGAGNTAPTYPSQPPQTFNPAPPNFDFPTVQLPIGQFGGSTPMQPPLAPPPGGNQGNSGGESDYEDDNQDDSRQRKSAQERMRSPNARRQQGRRVGGREVPGMDENIQDQPSAQDNRGKDFEIRDNRESEANRDSEKYAPYNMPISKPTNLVEESKFPAKLISAVILLALIVAGVYLYTRQGTPESENLSVAPASTGKAPSAPVTPATETNNVTPTTPVVVPPQANTPSTPAPQPLVPTAAAPAPTPTPKPTPTPEPVPKAPKIAAHNKPARVERVERPSKPFVEPRATEEPSPQGIPKGLRVTSEPSGAEVLVNFSKKGVTPIEISLSNNSNKIIVRMNGYKRYETTLPKNHPDHELRIDLEKEESIEARDVKPEPKVVSRPAPKVEARVEPKPEPRFEPKQEPEARADEYKEPQDLPIAKAKPERLEPPAPRAVVEAPLVPGDGPIGIIFLSSSPARADIFIDGKNTGKKTPAKIELPSGNHKIEMSKSGQKNSVTQQVNEGKNKAVHLTLQ